MPRSAERALSLQQLLRRAMGASAALAILTVGGLFVAFSYDLEDRLFRHWVAAEASRKHEGPRALPVGMTAHASHADLPAPLRAALAPDLPPGEYERSTDAGDFHVAVRRGDGGAPRYVVFHSDAFTATSAHLRTHAELLLLSALAALALSAAAALLASRRIARSLQAAVARARGGPEAAARPSGIREVDALLRELDARDARLQALLERERQFGRDASHELRTPLAIAQGAVELLERAPPRDAAAFERLRDAVWQMGLLTDGILWLSREPRGGERTPLRALSAELLRFYDSLRRPGVQVELPAHEVEAPLPGPVARVLLGNLLKNALQYTEHGTVRVTLEEGAWTLLDTGAGLGGVPPERRGFGVGLSIAGRLAERFGCTLTLGAAAPQGTQVTLRWGAGVAR